MYIILKESKKRRHILNISERNLQTIANLTFVYILKLMRDILIISPSDYYKNPRIVWL